MPDHEQLTTNSFAGDDTTGTRKPVPSWHLHRRMYDWVLQWADTRYGGWALFVMSFAESSFFPIPPDVLLAPLVLGNRRKWWKFAASCSLASLFGGMFGYAIGMWLWSGIGAIFHDHVPGFDRATAVLAGGRDVEGMFDHTGFELAPGKLKGDPIYPLTMTTADGERLTLAEPDVKEMHVHAFTRVATLYEQYDVWIVAAAGFTPLPYKVITITAGVFEINFFIFCLASALSRAARFFLVAGLMGWFGPTIKPLIDKYFNLLCIAFMVLLIGGFALLKLAA